MGDCFRALYGSLGQVRLGPPQCSPEGSTKVPVTVHHGSTKVLQVSWCLCFSGAGPSWAAFHQGSTKALQVSWCLWLSGSGPSWAAQRFRRSFHQAPRLHRGFTKVPPRLRKFLLPSSWAAKRFRGRFHQGSAEVRPRVHQGSIEVLQVLRRLRFFRAGPCWAAKRFRLKTLCVLSGRSVLGCQKVLS